MLGNLKGWLISLVLLVLTWGSVIFLVTRDAVPTPRAIPRTVDGRTASGQPIPAREALEPLALPLDPATVARPTEPGDGAAMLKTLVVSPPRDPRQLAQNLAKVGRQQRFDLPADELAGELSYYWPDRPLLGRLVNVIQTARREGPRILAADLDAGQELYEGLFLLGARLFESRLNYQQVILGMQLMLESAGQLGEVARQRGQTQRQVQIEEFYKTTSEFEQQYLRPIGRIMTQPIGGEVFNNYAGNIFLMARESRERVWRVESIHRLAAYRHNAARAGIRAAAASLLRDLAENEPDPLIRAAARDAYEITPQQVQRGQGMSG